MYLNMHDELCGIEIVTVQVAASSHARTSGSNGKLASAAEPVSGQRHHQAAQIVGNEPVTKLRAQEQLRGCKSLGSEAVSHASTLNFVLSPPGK